MIGISGNIWAGYGISALAALVGIWVQFMMQSRKIGKNERVYAQRMKGQVSRESEVEKARKILEEEDEEEEGSHSPLCLYTRCPILTWRLRELPRVCPRLQRF